MTNRMLTALAAVATVLAACAADPAPTSTIASAPTTVPPHPERIVAVGDSIMLGAQPALEAGIDGLVLDAKSSRQFAAGIAILEGLLADGNRPDLVLVHLGTNGLVTEELFDAMMAAAVDVSRVVFVNVKVPRPWEAETNQVLADGVVRYPNAELIDWYSASIDQPQYFNGSGYHLRPPGVAAFVDLIASGL